MFTPQNQVSATTKPPTFSDNYKRFDAVFFRIISGKFYIECRAYFEAQIGRLILENY